MVPLRLELKNFLSYGEPIQVIDFTGHNLICLSGKNGHGKSAILDALTWALWGQARKVSGASKADDGLVKLGQTKMLVILDFALRGQTYRVRREFYKSHTRPVASLDLQLWDAGRQEFISLTDKTIRQTQEKINQILKVDFETFTNSSFLRQGCANEFSKKSPRERKEILGKILGLHEFDQYQQKTALRLRQNQEALQHQELTRAKCWQHLQVIDEELVSYDQLEQEISSEEQSLAQCKELAQSLAMRKNRYDIACNEYAQKTASQENLQKELMIERDEFWHLFQSWQEMHQQYLTGKDWQKMQSLAEQTRQKLAVVMRAWHDQVELEKQVCVQQAACNQAQLAWQTELSREQNFLQNEQSSLTRALQQEEQQLIFWQQNQGDLLAKLAQIKKQQAALTVTVQEQAGDNLFFWQKKLEKESNRYKKFTRLGQEKKAKLQQDQASVEETCRSCGSKLSMEQQQNLLCRRQLVQRLYEHQLSKLRLAVPELKLRLVQMQEQVALWQAKVQNQVSAQAELSLIVAQEQKLQQEMAGVTCKLDEQGVKIAGLKQSLLIWQDKRQSFQVRAERLPEGLAEQQKHLLALQELVVRCAYDASEHRRLQTLYDDLQAKLALRVDPALLVQQKQQLKIALLKAKQKVKIYQQEITKQEALLAHLRAELETEGLVLKSSTGQINEQLQILQEKLLSLAQRKGHMQAQMKRKEQLQGEIVACDEAIVALREVQVQLQILQQAFSKNGIQAVLIEELLPAIEDETNKILSLISQNGAQVLFQSLKDLKSGGVRESLDIQISDYSGIKPYDMFSGGEAFRIDFALRIGIAKVIAQRSGTPLETIIVDEGFGSLDEDGVSLLMECIYKITRDFEKIIIVSHLQSLKDLFPVHFVVRKTPLGSKVTCEHRG